MATDDDFGSAPTEMSQPGVTLTPVPSPPPSVIGERYVILGLLGAGGMGRVYRAQDNTLDEVVALKILRRELVDRPGMLERFRQEVKLARRVTHANVVRTFDLGAHGDEHYLTMEYIDGRSLAQLLDNGPLALDDVLRIARAAAAGIEAAHSNGVLHRDLKPDNILVAANGRIAITDFGVATPAASPIDTVERMAGTPAYMAPEQVEPGVPLGPYTDIYAFGTILYEMLTGRRPFPGAGVVQIALARLRQPPPDPRAHRAVPARLAELVLRCMARVPADRFADGAALAAALAEPDLVTTLDKPVRLPATVPATTARSVAILPLQSGDDLADVAAGIAEEICDVLSMTRELRVRPLASIPKVHTDARALGQTLGVDVLVEGSVRRRGNFVRITARVIGVADGFQLWASHFDAPADNILGASDQVVSAVARALTVEVTVPARATVTARAAELYLAGKARLRAHWIGATAKTLISDLEEAHSIAPDDPAIMATLATALARGAFLRGGDAMLARSRELAHRAATVAPALGESWFARAVACQYSGETTEAAVALVRACAIIPGFAMAQGMLGGILLEAGAMDGAIRHLEAAESLDPLGVAHLDLPRAYIYADRWDDAMHQFAVASQSTKLPNTHLFDMLSRARFHMWRGETSVIEIPETNVPPSLAEFAQIAARVHATRELSPADRARMAEIAMVDTPRLRATFSQFFAEFLLFAGDAGAAMHWVEVSCASGLQDHMWMQHSPMLAPLRDRPAFQALAARIEQRANTVVEAALREVGKLS